MGHRKECGGGKGRQGKIGQMDDQHFAAIGPGAHSRHKIGLFQTSRDWPGAAWTECPTVAGGTMRRRQQLGRSVSRPDAWLAAGRQRWADPRRS